MREELALFVKGSETSLKSDDLFDLYHRLEGLEQRWAALISQVEKCCQSKPDLVTLKQKWVDQKTAEFVTVQDLEDAIFKLQQNIKQLFLMITILKKSCYVRKSSTTIAGLNTLARNCFSKMHKLMIISTRLITTSIRKILSLIIT